MEVKKFKGYYQAWVHLDKMVLIIVKWVGWTAIAGGQRHSREIRKVALGSQEEIEWENWQPAWKWQLTLFTEDDDEVI